MKRRHWTLLERRTIRQKGYAGIGVTFGLGLLMIGCSTPPPNGSTPETTLSPNQPNPVTQVSNRGQSLPITAQVQVGGQLIQLEVAKTPAQQEMGLMFRTNLEPNRGMLFLFNPPRPVNFWMKNMSISLDMVFLHKGKVVAIAKNVPPCQADPCPVYGPAGLVDQVIELRDGRAAELGLKVGDRLDIKPAK